MRINLARQYLPSTGRQSTGITYAVQITSAAPADQISRLLNVVDQVAEIPRALRAGAAVQRIA